MFGDPSLPVSHPPVPRLAAPGATGARARRHRDRRRCRRGGAARSLAHDLRSGEILGVAGVSGNGQRELAELILGLRRPNRGAKRLWGEDATHWSPARIRARGVASIPDDPLALAVVPGLTVRENLALGGGRRYYAGLGLDWRALVADMERSRCRLRFPPLPSDTPRGGAVRRKSAAASC